MTTRMPQMGTGMIWRMVMPWLTLGVVALLLPAAAQAQTPPEVVEYYHLDALGSVRAVTNESGAVVRTHGYRPFGEGENPTGGTDPTRFTGKERDTESGLDYFGARYYASRTGRFTTVDPGHVNGNIFDPQSWNAYAYARNNPLKYVDPTGTEYEICGYNESGGIGSCGSVSDQYFGSLSRTTGGHGMRLFGGTIWVDDRAVGSYRQTSVDPTFNSIFRDAGDRAAPLVNAAIAVGTAQVLIAGAAALPLAAAGSESLWLGTIREFGHIVGWGTGQGTAALTRQVAQTLTREGVKQMMRRGLTSASTAAR